MEYCEKCKQYHFGNHNCEKWLGVCLDECDEDVDITKDFNPEGNYWLRETYNSEKVTPDRMAENLILQDSEWYERAFWKLAIIRASDIGENGAWPRGKYLIWEVSVQTVPEFTVDKVMRTDNE